MHSFKQYNFRYIRNLIKKIKNKLLVNLINIYIQLTTEMYNKNEF